MKGASNLVLGLSLVAAAIYLCQGYVRPEPAAPVHAPQLMIEEVACAPDPEPRRQEVRERGLGAPVKNPWVLVRRGDRVLSLYDGDVLVKRYPIAVGGNLDGDKEREGDKRTPLGTFYVCTRNNKSRFHKFLGLSYPAPEDAERGLKARMITKAQHRAILEAHRAKRQPPWKTSLGGEVGLHGGGANRPEGTLGCVGLSDRHIDELWRILRMGARVVIER